MPGPAPPPPPDRATAVSDLRRDLLAWFDARARDLPWRRTDDPYAVWVSEVMLQQTRVETVVPYYGRWLARFPDVEALAGAEEEEVLKAWEGLGYYRRARMLHRAARVVRERHGGEVPSSRAALRELPGVGDYTAGAVASIAFGEAVPAVDGNVRRVLARLFDVAEPGAAWLRDTAAGLVDPDRPGDFNQALMELGATVCIPRSPRCGGCPLADACAARAAGTQEERPAARARKKVPTRAYGVAVAVSRAPDGPRVLLVRRPPEGLLGGMWEFPAVELAAGGDDDPEAAARRAAGAHGLEPAPAPLRRLATVRHAYSHFRGLYHPFVVEVVRPPAAEDGEAATWAGPERIAGLPLPRAQRVIAAAAAEVLRPGAGREP